MPASWAYSRNYIVKGLEYMGHNNIVTSASSSKLVTNYKDNPYAVLPLDRGGQIPPDIIDQFETSFLSMGIDRGIVVSPTALDFETTKSTHNKKIELITFDSIIAQVETEEKQLEEVRSGLIRLREESVGEPYVSSCMHGMTL
jgi:hypothetical protein